MPLDIHSQHRQILTDFRNSFTAGFISQHTTIQNTLSYFPSHFKRVLTPNLITLPCEIQKQISDGQLHQFTVSILEISNKTSLF